MAVCTLHVWYPTKEECNYARLCRLLVDIGSHVLRDIFDRICPPGNLHTVLTDPKIHAKLQTLQKNRVLSTSQWCRLYPVIKSSVSSRDFDTSLLLLLLKNIGGLTLPTSSWVDLPLESDTTPTANIIRLKILRDRVYSHASDASVDDVTFSSYWYDIKDTFLRIGGAWYEDAINDIKIDCMDAHLVEHYQDLFREWLKDDDYITNKSHKDETVKKARKQEDKDVSIDISELRSGVKELLVKHRPMNSANANPPELSVKFPNLSDLPKVSSPWCNVELPVDILLLTMEDCEFLSCFAYLKESFKSYHISIGHVYFGCMGDGQGKKMKIALTRCCKGSDVPGGSLSAAKDAIFLLRPKVTFSVGACSGLKNRQVKLGDVVVSSKLITGTHKTPPSRNIGNLIKDRANGWKAPLQNGDEYNAKVHFDGVVLSISEANKDIIGQHPEAIAVEMEGGGEFAAALKTKWVFVKGIKDFANDGQSSSEKWKQIACMMAASVVANILSDPVIFQGWLQFNAASSSQEGQENRRLKITLLSSEWRSSTDGDLSTINRELAIQLAKHPNVEVSVFLPQCSEEDRNNAASHDVQLVVAETLPGLNPVASLMFVPDGHVMDCVVGHGVTLGKQVQVIRKLHQCKWIQVVHTAPEELGMYKSISHGEQLQKTEVALCEKADQVVAIGPKLTDAYKHYLHCSQKEQNVFDLTPSIFSEFLEVKQAIEERRTFSVLVIGSSDSCEDYILKGYDLAAQAIAELKDKSYQLKFVDAPSGKGNEIAYKLLQHGIDHNQLTVRSFSDRREVLANLFCKVDLAIMPFKTEGFGINALEALSAGLPVFVSSHSGFGEALKKVPLGSQCVIDSEDPKVWAREIKAVRRKKRSVRLAETKILREKYLAMYSWEKAIRSLVERMYSLIFALKGSSGGQSSHSSMKYGQCPLPSTSVTQDKLVQEGGHTESSSGSHSSNSYMECGPSPFPTASATQEKAGQQRNCTQALGSESRPLIPTGDKRPSFSDFLDHHSKRFKGKLIKYDHLEGSSGGYSSHLPTEYGQFSLPSASVTQGNPVQEKNHTQASSSQEGQENRRLKITLLSSEWRSSTDGDLSTINRELAIQLAKHSNVEVSVFLPQCSEEDRNNAASHDVQLVVAETLPGLNPVASRMFVPDGHVIDCVVGHGVTLGKQVQVIRKLHQCKWIQVVHTAPDELGMYKRISQGDQLQKTEVALCEKADQVVAIGPKLTDAYKRYLRCSQKEQNVFELTPSVFSEFLEVKQATEERRTFSVLVIGSGDSCEDFILKGYDLAAQAIAELKDKSYQLKFVGAPRGRGDEIADKLLQHGIDHNQLTVRSFSDSREVLANLFCEVDLAIMPSKTEGFGINALEALSAGLPVFVSGNSGFGEALKEVPLGSQCVIDSEDPKVWAMEIKAVRQKKRSVRLAETKILREKYLEMYSWEKPIRSLVERMYSLIFAVKGSSGGQSSHFSMKDGQFPLPSTSATQDKLVQVESHNQSSEGRPVIATRDKRSPSTVLGDHHSKPLGGRLLRFDHYEVLGCSSCGHSSHSFMEYGQSPFPTASLTQDKPVQQSSYTQGLRSRPVIATGDKRPASTVFGDHRSKQFRGEVNKYDFYEALKGTSVGQLSHSLMDYGEEHVEQRTQTQDYPEQLEKLIRREYKGTVLCPFPWCEDELQFELSKIFTRLTMVSREIERTKLTNDIVQMTEVYRPIKKCDCKQKCECENEKPRVVLIEGLPGMGKTTYCQKLAYDWSVGNITTESSFPKLDLLLRLTCRDIETDNIEAAIEAQLLPIDVNKKDKEIFFQFIRRNQSRILLVLDGLDELRNDLFEKYLPLIKGKAFPFTFVMLTARHEVGMKVRPHCDALFEIVGYTKDDADSYIKKYFRKHENPSLAEALIKEINKDSQLRELTANALNTALLCLVFEGTNGVLPYNRTMLYIEIVNCVLRRYRINRSTKRISLDDKNLVEEYADQLNQLGKLALKALLQDQLGFTLEELKNQSTEFLDLGFLSRQASKSRDKAKPTYAFIHKTFQEYFAAFHMAHELLTADGDKTALLKQLSPIYRYWQVWKFLITMAASKSDDTAALLVSSICDSFQHEKPDQFSSDTKYLRYVFVFEDTNYDWELEQPTLVRFPVDEQFSFLLKVVDAIIQCEQPKSELKPYQIKMAGTLARCFPRNRITVNHSGSGITFNCRFPFVFSEYLKANCKLKTLAWQNDVSNAKLDESVVAALADVLKTSHTMSHLYLTDYSYIISLTPALQENHTLTHLNVRKARLRDEGAKELGKVLQSNDTLTHLCVADNEITPNGIEALAEGMKSNKVLEHFNIGKNGIGDKGAKALGILLQSNHTLTYLCAADSEITPIGVENLAEALKSNKVLKHLNIGKNNIGDKGAKALGILLQSNHTLTHLCVADNKLTLIGVEALAEALKFNRVLEDLNIGQNDIGDEGAVSLSQVLESNRTLRCLNVSGDSLHVRIGGCGMRVIVHALLYNSSLTYLDIHGHGFNDSSLTELGKALQSKCSLTHLCLGMENSFPASASRFGDSSAAAFSKALQSHDTQLTRLDLRSTSIVSSCVITLAEGLRVNGTLERLDLSQNYIENRGAVALAHALKTNQTLTHLQLRENHIGNYGANEFVELLQCNKTLMFLGLLWNCITALGIDFFKVLGGRLESRLQNNVGGLKWIRN